MILALVLAATIPISGPEVPELAAFDQEIVAVMEKWDVPGGSLAISVDGRLVLARGYGFANLETQQAVLPSSLFRIASVSKPITAVAILTLHQEGRLDLDDKVADHLRDLLPAGGPADPRVETITIRDLLRHSGGWDMLQGAEDIQFTPHAIAQAYGVPSPPSAEQVAAFALNRHLEMDPGTGYAYANVGYTILGRIIERVTGQPYERFVRQEVLAPMGVQCMRIGGTLEGEAARGEVRYYAVEATPTAPSIWDETVMVPWAYGAFDMRALDAAGGWITSPVDMLRFLDSVDGRGADVLQNTTIETMTARPPYQPTGLQYYALGWVVQRSIWFHTGGLPGTASYVIRLPSGVNLFAVFNSLPAEEFYTDLDAALGNALQRVGGWPAHDLYDSIAGCELRRRAVGAR